MTYGDLENLIIVALDTALAIFKGVKKLRAIIKKKSKKFSITNEN